jgi:glycosidase
MTIMPEWLKDAVFYEIYPQSFNDTNGDGIGDINGITDKLDYIKGLGCNAIWINPCYDSPFRDAGYDVRDYLKVAPRYGTNEDLYRCFREAHKRGMHILLDLVPGHTSDTHKWFRQSSRASRNRYSDRYIWTDSVWNRPADFGCMCGMAERDGCYILNFFNSQPALNYGFNQITAPWQMPYTAPECQATFDAMLDIMRFWLDNGCDGFRVDMADSLVKNDDDKTATSELWRRCRAMLDRDYPEAAMVSEWSCPQRSINMAKFHMDFYLDHETNGYHALFRKTDRSGRQMSFFSKRGSGNIMDFLDDYLPKYKASKDSGYISFITCNHDTPRMTLGFDDLECRLAFCFLMTMPGVPFVYYGDEIGMRYIQMTSREGGYGRTGTRTPMQWTDGENKGFSTADARRLYLPVDTRAGSPSVESAEKDPDSILNSMKAVLKLRHKYRDLQADAPFDVIYARRDKYPFVFCRGSLVIAVNPAQAVPTPVKDIKLPGRTDSFSGRSLFTIGSASLENGTLTIGGQSMAIFTAD